MYTSEVSSVITRPTTVSCNCGSIEYEVFPVYTPADVRLESATARWKNISRMTRFPVGPLGEREDKSPKVG